jgi:diaminopimelate decarboxylase
MTDIPSGFRAQGRDLIFAGKTVSEWVERYGTPLYLYDTARLKAKHDALRAAMPKDLYLSYAIKANPNVDIIRFLGKLYDGVDLASMGEMAKAMEAGVDPARMSFAGPGKSPAELEFAIKNGIGAISVEGERELEHIGAIAARLGKPARVYFRVNPAFELGSAGLKMGGGSKQFGVDAELIPDLVKSLKGNSLVTFHGLHFFTGVQNLNADAILSAYGKILDYAADLVESAGASMEVLNLGGGFGIPHHRGDGELDLAKVGEGMGKLFAAIRPRLPKTRFKIELGRFIVGECGLYVAKVLYRKISRGAPFLIMDGGLHQYLAASGHMSGNPIHRPMNIVIANRMDAAPEKVNVVGPLCTPLDRFGFNLELPRAEEGDLVAVLNAGAYGYSMSPLAFLSHPLPKEAVI